MTRRANRSKSPDLTGLMRCLMKSKTVSLTQLPTHYRRTTDIEFLRRPEVVEELRNAIIEHRRKQAERKTREEIRRHEDALFIDLVSRDIGRMGLPGLTAADARRHLRSLMGVTR